MKNRWLNPSYLAICCAVAILCGLVSAQEKRPTSGTADIPFDFYISGSKLPAGQYTLDRIVATYVLLHSSDGKVSQDLYLLQNAGPVPNTPNQLVFALRDGKYYFAEVWSWYGKSQLSSFNPQAGDQTKDVPLKAAAEK